MALTGNTRWVVMLGGLALTLYLVWNAPEPEDAAVSSLPQRANAGAQSGQLSTVAAADWRSLMSSPRAWREEDEGADPFMNRLPVPPKAATKEVAPPPVEPTPPPEPPSLPFKFVGGFNRGGDDWGIYLTNGDKLYTVHAGDELEGKYHVDEIFNGQVVFTYKPLNVQQVLDIGG